MVWRPFILGGLIAAGTLPTAQAAPRAKPDPSAIQDAIGDRSEPPERYVSARALAHYMLSVVAHTEGDSDTEIAELRLAALYDAENPYAQSVLAREYLRLGDLRAARQAAAEALALDPNHAPTLALVGRLELQTGNAERAAMTLRRAVALAPNQAEPTALLIDALLKMGSPTAATTAAEKLSKLVTESSAEPVRQTVAGVLGRVAESLAREGRTEQAEHFFLRAAALEPTRVERQVALARFYEVRDRAGDAAECYARAVGLTSERSTFALDAARLFLRADKAQRAAGYIALLSTDPKGSVPLLRLGQLLEESGVRDEAVRAYETAGHASAGWGEPLVRAGRLLEGLGRYPEAALRYREVSVSDEQRAEAEGRAELCDLRTMEGRRHESELLHRLRALVQRSPPLPEAFDLLARTLASRRDHLEEAETIARDALARWPERAESLQSFGRVLLAQGKPEAFDVLEKAAGLLSSLPEAQLDLAEAALAAGHPDAATAAVNKAQTLLQGVTVADLQHRFQRVSAQVRKSEGRPAPRSLRARGK